ncbi:type II secretion system F family protein [Paenibacillus sp. CN-4]|uniref:type II secretion system F family protein n=1 Tax=Paenibacillus nanchangensis TaxID=3348343 RepID=UPI003979C0B3
MAGVSALLMIVLAAGWVVLKLSAGLRYAALRELTLEGARLRQISEPFLLLIDKLGLGGRFPRTVFKIQRSIQRTMGIRSSAERTLLFLAEMLAYSWLLLLCGCALSLASGESAGIVLGTVLSAAVPAALAGELHKKVKQRQQRIVMELPELLNGIVLLVGAGETVQRAITRCVERTREAEDHPLYRELRVMMAEWESGYSFQQAFENFSKRCAVQEVSIFATAVLLNYRRGGTEFALGLRDLSRMLWEKRKAISRTRGEQASSKLVFPMVVIFVIVIVLVGSPAFMMMNI